MLEKVPSIDEMIFKPIIIACTALVDEDTRIKTQQAGFDAVYQVPLQQSQIQKEILPMIMRKQELMTRKEILQQQFKENLENQLLNFKKNNLSNNQLKNHLSQIHEENSQSASSSFEDSSDGEKTNNA